MSPKAKALIARLLPFGVCAFFILLFIQGISLITPFVMQRIIDRYIPAKDMRAVLFGIVFLVGIPVVHSVGQALYQYYSAVVGRKCAYEINQAVIGNILAQPMSFHDRHHSGELAAQATRDSLTFVLLFTRNIPETVSVLMISAVALALVFSMNPWLGVIQLFYLPFALIPGKIVGGKVQKNAEKLFDIQAKMRAFVQEAFRGVKFIKIGGIAEAVLSKYKSMFLGTVDVFAKTAAAETLVGGIASQMSSSVFTGLGFLLGAFLIIEGEFTLGGLVSFLALVPRLHGGITSLLQTNIQYKKQLGEFHTLFEYLEMSREKGGDLQPAAFLQHDLRVEHVSFRYGDSAKGADKALLSGVSLDVPRGKWIGIEGESGIGKSTLIDLILRLYPPDEGTVRLDGTPCDELDLAWYWRHIAYVQQNPFLFAGTVRENMRFVAPGASDEAIWNALQAVRLAPLVRSSPLGLDMPLGEDGSVISGGEKQRFAIAAALLTGKPLIVLDEATSNLDEKTEREIADMLHARVESGCTVVSVSHRKAFHRYADALYHVDRAGIRRM